jgi:CarboxypepD_reg-like domain
VNLKLFLFVFSALSLISLRTVAQTYNCAVEGRVISQATGQPLENVNVYISNTVWGTTTNKNGYFKIESLPFGNLNVVASMVGYETQSIPIIIKERDTAEVNFNLKEASYKINPVLVTGKTPKDWEKNLEEFKKYFFGERPNTDGCEILNPEVINLNKTESGDLTANASQSIIIINNALGYKLRCDLVSFEWDNEKQTLQYIVETYFTELKDTTGKLKNEWLKNRENTYYGSTTDFIKSLTNNTYRDEGFRVYQDKHLPMNFSPLYKTYYELDKIIINKINDSYAELNFNGYLRIEYDSDFYNNTEISWIKLKFPNVLIDKFGYPIVALAFKIYGDWAYGGMANMLPKYYNPEEAK